MRIHAGTDAIHDLHDQEDDEPHGQEEHDAAEEEPREDVSRAVHDHRRHQAHDQMLHVHPLYEAAYVPRQTRAVTLRPSTSLLLRRCVVILVPSPRHAQSDRQPFSAKFPLCTDFRFRPSVSPLAIRISRPPGVSSQFQLIGKQHRTCKSIAEVLIPSYLLCNQPTLMQFWTLSGASGQS